MKNKGVAYVLWLFGLHRLYLEKPITAIFYIITVGGAGVWCIYDLFTISSQVNHINDQLCAKMMYKKLEVLLRFAKENTEGIKEIRVTAEEYITCEKMRLGVNNSYMEYQGARVLLKHQN